MEVICVKLSGCRQFETTICVQTVCLGANRLGLCCEGVRGATYLAIYGEGACSEGCYSLCVLSGYGVRYFAVFL